MIINNYARYEEVVDLFLLYHSQIIFMPSECNITIKGAAMIINIAAT